MADFSLVKDQQGMVRGIWLANPKEADDIFLLSMLAARISNEQGPKFPSEHIASVLAKQYRVVPNTYDRQGGCFVMFGSALAPGE